MRRQAGSQVPPASPIALSGLGGNRDFTSGDFVQSSTI
jgi:hypothetical protein